MPFQSYATTATAEPTQTAVSINQIKRSQMTRRSLRPCCRISRARGRGRQRDQVSEREGERSWTFVERRLSRDVDMVALRWVVLCSVPYRPCHTSCNGAICDMRCPRQVFIAFPWKGEHDLSNSRSCDNKTIQTKEQYPMAYPGLLLNSEFGSGIRDEVAGKNRRGSRQSSRRSSRGSFRPMSTRMRILMPRLTLRSRC